MNIKRIATMGVASLGIAALVSSGAFAQTGSTVYQANLQQQNESGTTGTATAEVNGDQLTVSVNVTDISPNLPHAQHIRIGGQGTCPDESADENNDGQVTTTEAQPLIGDIRVSLTTQGDVSADSALAVDRFPVADQNGALSYQRTFTIPSGVDAANLENSVVYMHGISEVSGDPSKYDGSAKSDLDPGLPAEATLPTACGVLRTAPVGGVGAGSGSTAGIENAGLAVAGTVAIAAGATLAARKFAASRNI